MVAADAGDARGRGPGRKILVVQGTYSQDWLLYDTIGTGASNQGRRPSRCMADIGSHFFDMAEQRHRTARHFMCADLQTFHPTRKRRSIRSRPCQ